MDRIRSRHCTHNMLDSIRISAFSCVRHQHSVHYPTTRNHLRIVSLAAARCVLGVCISFFIIIILFSRFDSFARDSFSVRFASVLIEFWFGLNFNSPTRSLASIIRRSSLSIAVFVFLANFYYSYLSRILLLLLFIMLYPIPLNHVVYRLF